MQMGDSNLVDLLNFPGEFCSADIVWLCGLEKQLSVHVFSKNHYLWQNSSMTYLSEHMLAYKNQKAIQNPGDLYYLSINQSINQLTLKNTTQPLILELI